MNNLDKNIFFNSFSHIYIEKDIFYHKRVQTILEHFPNTQKIEINHYKDIFCRGKQNIPLQKKIPMLILAKKEHHYIYKGAPVCQNFGFQNFYYTSCIMNCIYNCEYCYLQGMYPSGNIVIFINLEDIFYEIEQKLKNSDIYLCISYDTDLLALEGLTGYVREWIDFAGSHPGLTIEIRTKSASFQTIKELSPPENVILAWTFSPPFISEKYEHGAPDFHSRVFAAKEAIQHNWKVRLCFDPMIYTKDWKEKYQTMITQIFSELLPEKIFDVSMGLFRVSKSYLKKMRKQNPDSSVLFYPYELTNGVYEYPGNLAMEMNHFMYQQLLNYLEPEKIFNWEGNN